MGRIASRSGPLAVLAGALLAVGASHASPAGCDEQCLDGIMDRYLAALAAHDPARSGLAQAAKTTENEMPVAPGDGLWQTIDRFTGYRHVIADPDSGQVAAFATIEEHGSPALITLRLRTKDRRVTEAETLVVRSQAFLNTKLGTVKPIFTEIVQPAERLSRARLTGIANSYFDSILAGDGDIAPFDPLCNRTENGIQTTNNPDLAMPGSPGQPKPKPLGCHDQIDSGVFSYITEVTPRRFVIVDPSRNLVFGMFMFRHSGAKTTGRSKDGHEVKMIPAAMRPFNVEVSELFKIERGKIREIEAVMAELPYRTPSAWAGAAR